ncbi:E3 ubiquitin-protein ligase SIRP1 [Linum perenne]
MLYLAFEFQPIHQTLSQDECPQSRVLRSFPEMQQEGSVEATVDRIVESFLQAVTQRPNLPSKPILSPLIKCVAEAMNTEGVRPADYRRVDEVKMDVQDDGGDHHSSYKVFVERFSAQATVADEGDYDDEDMREFLENWTDEYGDEEMAVEDEAEDDGGEAALALEAACLRNVTVGSGVDCGVCLDGITVGSEAAAMGCRHLYHGECIRKWLRQRKTAAACPLCRFPAAIV